MDQMDDSREECGVETQDFSPGTLGCHEALDRLSIFAELFEKMIIDHCAINNNPIWKEKAEHIVDETWDLYMLVGHDHLTNMK